MAATIRRAPRTRIYCKNVDDHLVRVAVVDRRQSDYLQKLGYSCLPAKYADDVLANVRAAGVTIGDVEPFRGRI